MIEHLIKRTDARGRYNAVAPGMVRIENSPRRWREDCADPSSGQHRRGWCVSSSARTESPSSWKGSTWFLAERLSRAIAFATRRLAQLSPT